MKIFKLEIRAESKEEAVKIIKKAESDKLDYWFEEQEEPTNWREYAKDYAKDIFDYLELKDYKKKIDKDKSNVDEVFDEIYQEEDLTYKAQEQADGSFIYNGTEAVKEALDCINELSEWEETDNGLWDRMDSAEEQTNTRATYTLSNAIYYFLEEMIKEYLN